jgi:hypothetical protein
MKLDEQLNLVIPVDREDGSTLYVHAAPISREVFERYWLVLSKSFAQMYTEGLGPTVGPRVAALMLKQVAQELGQWEGPLGVERGVMAEIRRLANVAAPGANGASGWQIYPLDDLINRKLIDADDVSQIENILVFFTLVWRLHLPKDRRIILDGAARMWSASTTSDSLSTFVGSLATSNATASSGATPPVPSSPPSSTGPAAPASKPSSGNGPVSSPGVQPMSSASVI